MGAPDTQADLLEGAAPAHLAVVVLAVAVKRDPDEGGAGRCGCRQHLTPVVTDGDRHPGGREWLVERACLRLVALEELHDTGRLGMGRHLVHRVGLEGQPPLVTEPVRRIQCPGDLSEWHRRVRHALRPAVPTDRGAAYHLHAEVERPYWHHLQYPASPAPRVPDDMARCLPTDSTRRDAEPYSSAGHLTRRNRKLRV
jgi:hypothetical protein